MSNLLKLGLPKGSLQESTFHLFAKAGYKISSTSRSYFPNIDDVDMKPMLIRAQEMSRYVEDGVLDVGITGRDWVRENGSKVQEVAELIYAKVGLKPVRWVLAVPANSDIKGPKDLQGKRIATELRLQRLPVSSNRTVRRSVLAKSGCDAVSNGAGCADESDGRHIV